MQAVEASAPLRRPPTIGRAARNRGAARRSRHGLRRRRRLGLGQLGRDYYVGYLPSARLDGGRRPTHRVATLRTHAYPGPSIKLPPHMALSLGARADGRAAGRRFPVTADGRHLWARHLAAIESHRAGFRRGRRALLEPPISGAGAPPKGSTAPASSRRPLPPPGSRPRATATCWRRRSASRSPSTARSRAAISCSGRATSGSCATPPRCFTPTAGT